MVYQMTDDDRIREQERSRSEYIRERASMLRAAFRSGFEESRAEVRAKNTVILKEAGLSDEDIKIILDANDERARERAGLNKPLINRAEQSKNDPPEEARIREYEHIISKSLHDHASEMATALRKGKVEGIEEGKAIGRAEGEAIGMAKGRAEGEAIGMAKGKAEGEAIGMAKGEAKGRAEGEAKGRAEGMEQAMKSMRKSGMSEEQIKAALAFC